MIGSDRRLCMKDLSRESTTHNLLEEEFKAVQESRKKSSLQQFQSDFYHSKDPLTEIMVQIRKGFYVRSENVDYLDKEFMLVN